MTLPDFIIGIRLRGHSASRDLFWKIAPFALIERADKYDFLKSGLFTFSRSLDREMIGTAAEGPPLPFIDIHGPEDRQKQV